MSMYNIFNIAGSGMSAQSIRLNTISSNLANADSIGTTPEDVYKARHPVFSTMFDRMSNGASAGVQVLGIVESQADPVRRYDPDNQLADDKGYVYQANVNSIEEMTDMISASRSFQNNIEALNTAKQMMLATLRLGE